MFWRFGDIMTPSSRKGKIKMRVQTELKCAKFADQIGRIASFFLWVSGNPYRSANLEPDGERESAMSLGRILWSLELHTKVQPVFVSKKIGQDLHECETKPQVVNQQCVVYQFQCNLCDTGRYVGYRRGHLFTCVDGHKSKSSSVRKHYNKDYAGAVPEDLLSCFRVLKKCKNKFDYLVNEILCIKQLRPPLNLQTCSIRAKVFA